MFADRRVHLSSKLHTRDEAIDPAHDCFQGVEPLKLQPDNFAKPRPLYQLDFAAAHREITKLNPIPRADRTPERDLGANEQSDALARLRVVRRACPRVVPRAS